MVPPPLIYVEVGVQLEGLDVSTISMQTDISCVQVVWKTPYASVASQACPKVGPIVGIVNMEMEET